MDGLARQEYNFYYFVGVALDFDHNRGDANVSTEIKDKNEYDQEYINFGCVAYSVADVGINHLHWATQGKSMYAKCQPQTSDYSDKFLCIHNGTLRNDDDIKKIMDYHHT
ncbi:Glutamine--fructose-6-phosphate aminotransferase [isomerizing] [Thelohanellus kitauei]|uniref:glutamine--fructose-6-phosphate transaminase (isomerizing) n=1 Tax=Thelohanellus kitauei TaxID=669202 RepID=A0A0C2IU19_THEKT|nr:Glutamine--fructose-6-phosphate aminotransferase [isomerizing] [Thelohanellus kitauei]